VRAQDPIVLGYVRDKLFLVPYVVAGSDDMDPGPEELVDKRLGKSEAGCNILTVCDDKIDFVFVDQVRQQGLDSRPAAFSDNVSDEKDFHVSSK
jgi:hypothetical protein